MQQKIQQMEQIMRRFTQGSSTSQPSVIDPSTSPQVTTNTDSKRTSNDFE